MAKIKILFKSGNSQEFTCDTLKVTKMSDNSIAELEWKNMIPSPLYICLNTIEAVLELKED